MLNEYASFASRFSIAAQDAYVIPAAFERCAAIAQLPVRTLLSQATYSNHALGEYIASVIRKVASEDRAAQ